MPNSLLISILLVLAAGISVWLGVLLLMGKSKGVKKPDEKAQEMAEGEDTDSGEEGETEEGETVEEETVVPGVLELAHNEYMVPSTAPDDVTADLNRQMENLPPLPRVALNILPLLSSSKTSAKDIARVISIDPLLGGKILRRVNSSFYALDSKVDSIQHAIMLLGFDSIRSLTIRESFDSMLADNPVDEFTANLLWRHMAAISLFSKQLAVKSRGVDSNMASTIGLLHDIGMIVLMAINREGMADSLKKSVKEKRPLCECEEELLTYNHQMISFALTRKWNLSSELCDAIGRHHSPWDGEELNRPAGIVWLAHHAAHVFGYAYRPVEYDEAECIEITKELGLQWPLTRIITQGFLRELKNILTMWDIEDPTVEGMEKDEELPLEMIL